MSTYRNPKVPRWRQTRHAELSGARLRVPPWALHLFGTPDERQRARRRSRSIQIRVLFGALRRSATETGVRGGKFTVRAGDDSVTFAQSRDDFHVVATADSDLHRNVGDRSVFSLDSHNKTVLGGHKCSDRGGHHTEAFLGGDTRLRGHSSAQPCRGIRNAHRDLVSRERCTGRVHGTKRCYVRYFTLPGLIG